MGWGYEPKRAKMKDWDAILQQSINDCSEATGCGVNYIQTRGEVKISLNEQQVISFTTSSPEFAASLFFDGVEIGARLMQDELTIKPGRGKKAEKKLRRNTSAEDIYDDQFRKAYAKIAVTELEDLSTEGLLMIMRQCFIEGVES
jgi:hypothetical protein